MIQVHKRVSGVQIKDLALVFKTNNYLSLRRIFSIFAALIFLNYTDPSISGEAEYTINSKSPSNGILDVLLGKFSDSELCKKSLTQCERSVLRADSQGSVLIATDARISLGGGSPVYVDVSVSKWEGRRSMLAISIDVSPSAVCINSSEFEASARNYGFPSFREDSRLIDMHVDGEGEGPSYLTLLQKVTSSRSASVFMEPHSQCVHIAYIERGACIVGVYSTTRRSEKCQ